MSRRRRPPVSRATPALDPDLAARREVAARTLFGCEHPERHHYLTADDADQGMVRLLAHLGTPDPVERWTVRRCCQAGFTCQVG